MDNGLTPLNLTIKMGPSEIAGELYRPACEQCGHQHQPGLAQVHGGLTC